jgi:C-terminal processing protease CtpA/Prc
VVGALNLIEDRALYSDTLDWPAVRADVPDRCAGATAYGDTHDALAGVLRRAGGPHSGLRPPGAKAWRAAERPTGELLDRAGYVRLPAYGGADREYRDTGCRVMRDLAATAPTGWVVDLRGNLGGSMWPMLAVVAPLLPDGALGYFVPPHGPDLPWELRQGRVRLNGRTLARTTGPPGPGGSVPVAVLTDAATASSGEAVAVAFRARPHVRTFGAATMGMTSANETHTLRGGTRLNITVAYFADHRRTAHRGPLPPDEDGHPDPLTAAVDWLHRPR